MEVRIQSPRILPYKRLRLDYSVCFYCGLLADTVDHIPPKSAEVLPNRLRELIPACRECNSLLGARMPWDKNGRRRLIKRLLRKRYKCFLKPHKWAATDIEDLGPILKSTIESHASSHEILVSRLSYRAKAYKPPKEKPSTKPLKKKSTKPRAPRLPKITYLPQNVLAELSASLHHKAEIHKVSTPKIIKPIITKPILPKTPKKKKQKSQKELIEMLSEWNLKVFHSSNLGKPKHPRSDIPRINRKEFFKSHPREPRKSRPKVWCASAQKTIEEISKNPD